MLPRESVFLEYKESVTPSYLKTVSAFANFGSGRVVFGVDDGRCAVGLEDPAGDALRIENAINDSIDPRPVFSLEVDEEARTVTLIAKGRRMTRSEISGAVGFSKDKTIRILNTLVARGLVERLGEGPGTRYRRA